MSLLWNALWVVVMGTTVSNTTLTVNINDIENPGEGVIYVMLWDQSDGFPKTTENAKYRGVIRNFGATTSYTFEGVPQGSYAVTTFQDENGNQALDTNMLGLPKEPIGAYNVTGLSRPSFERSTVKLNQTRQSITLKMLND